MTGHMEPFRFNPGGYITGGYVTGDFPLEEGERLIDSFGYTRAVWSGGRLLWFPMWFSRYLPRVHR